MTHHPIALVVALAQERRALQHCLSSVRRWPTGEFHAVIGGVGSQAVTLIQAGIGRDRACRALLTAAHEVRFRAAWSMGFAGGLAETLGPGDVVCPAVVLQDDGRRGQPVAVAGPHVAVRAALSSAGIPASGAALLTVDVPLRTPEAKREVHRRTGAVAVDMEAAGVAEAARVLGIPWLALKSVVDDLEEPLPGFLASCTTPEGGLRWRGIVGSLCGDGNTRRVLRRLGLASRRAALALRRSFEVGVRACSP